MRIGVLAGLLLAAALALGCGRSSPTYDPPPGAANNGATGAYSFVGPSTWTYKKDAGVSVAKDVVEAEAGGEDVGIVFFDY